MVIKINTSDSSNKQQGKGFKITDQRIEVVNRAAQFMTTISVFTKWTCANIQNVDLEECNSIYEDFVKSNEHIIAKINKIRDKV